MHFISGNPYSELDVDLLVKKLRAEFPSTRIISQDYYADRLAREKAIARELGMAEDSEPIHCTERVALEHGTQLHLAIPISNETTLDTRIDKLGILAIGEQDTEQFRTEITSLMDILASFPLKIETSWDDVN
jgi:hypothetical protein